MEQPDFYLSGDQRIDLTRVRALETFQPLGIEAVLKARRLRVVMADDSDVVLDEADGASFVTAMDAHLGLP